MKIFRLPPPPAVTQIHSFDHTNINSTNSHQVLTLGAEDTAVHEATTVSTVV